MNDILKELIKVCFKIDDELQFQEEKSERLKTMSKLARQGLKNTAEFKRLENEFNHPTVIDISYVFKELRSIVKQIKRHDITYK